MQYCPPSWLLKHVGIEQNENVDPSILVKAAAALCLAAESSPQGQLEIQGVQLSTADIRYLFDGLLEHPQAWLWHRFIQSDAEVMKFLMNGESLKSPLYAYNLMLAYPDFRQFTMLWVSDAAYRFLTSDMLNEATLCSFYFLEPIHKRGDYWEQAVQDAMLKILNQTETELKQIIQINWREAEMGDFKKQALSYKKLDCLYILYRQSKKEPPSYFLDLLEFADKLADYKLLLWATSIRMLVDKYASLSPSIHQRLRQSGFTPTSPPVFPAGEETKPQIRRERDNWERDSDKNLISAFKTLMRWIFPH
jgi:hypothetical protein